MYFIKARKNASGSVKILSLLATLLLAINTAAEQPLKETGTTLKPNELLTWVLQQNPGLKELQAAAQVAIHRIEPAGSLDDPSLAYAFAPRTFGAKDHGLNQKIEFSQALPWPGTLGARESAARHSANAAQLDVDALRLQLAEKTKAAYAEWYFIDRALSIHHATHTMLGELRATAQTQYAAGRARQQDALLAAAEEISLKRHLLKLERAKRWVQANINTLLNRAPEFTLPAPAMLSPFPELPTLTALKNSTASQHPKLHRSRSLIAKGQAEVELAQKAFYPDIRLNASYNSLWDDPDKRPTLGFAITLPINQGKRNAVLDGAKADVIRAQSQRDDVHGQLLAKLIVAHAGFEESIQAIQLYQDELYPLAQEIFTTALSDYRSGAGSFEFLINAERKTLETEEALARSQADALRYQAELEHWAGQTLAAINSNSAKNTNPNRSTSTAGEQP